MARTNLLRLLALSTMLGWSLGGRAATRIWTGTLNTNWAAAKNWSNNVAPKVGDTLVFPQGVARLDTWNQLTSAFEEVRLEGAYTVGGSPIKTRLLTATSTAGFLRLQAGIQFQPDGGLGGVHSMELLGPVSVAGDTGVGGLEPIAFSGTVSGPGRLLCFSGASLRQTNSYTGGTVVYTNSSVTLEVAGTLGATNAPVEIRPGGQLTVQNPRTITQPITIGGFGRRGLGAALLAGVQTKLSQPLTLSGDTLISTVPTTAVSITMSGATAAPDTIDPRLVKSGVGQMSLLSSSNQFFVPLQIAQGNFLLVPDLPSPRSSLWGGPVFLRPLIVGSLTNRFPIVCDVELPRRSGTGPVLPNFVFGPDVVVTVLSNATLVAGPRQQGLGNPLVLDGGTVLLFDLTGAARPFPQGEHTGEIRVSGRLESAVEGWLNVTNGVVVRSTNNAPIRFGGSRAPQITAADCKLSGDQLTLDGVRARFAGNSANTLTNLTLIRGELSLGKVPAAVAAAQTNVIGTDSPTDGTAVLRSLGQFQFPALAHLEIKPTGQLVCTQSTSLGRLLVSGGRAELAHTSVSRLDLAAGSELKFAVVSAASHSLSANFIGQMDDGVQASLAFPATSLSGTPIMLLKLAGTDFIPRRFAGLPQDLTLTNRGSVYRVNYRGGDGNDLVLDKVELPPTPAPPLRIVRRGTESVTVAWPESAGGCELQVLELFGPASTWNRVPVPPAVNGEFSFTISPLPGQPTAFYRLNCP